MENPLPQCNTGHVHMLMSIKRMNFACIGKTKCVRTRMQKQNHSVEAVDTEPIHLRPHDVFAYVCGVLIGKTIYYFMLKMLRSKREIK